MSRISTLGAHELTAPADRLVTLPEFPHGAGIPTLGYLAVEWAERNLVQPNGPRAGQRFRFTNDQVNFMLWAYALDRDARWLFNHLARRLAKGSGKSPFAAAYALVEFLAPVRLERFDDRELGGVRGRPVDMALVQIAATAESQTSNTMRYVRAFCPKNGQLARDYGIDVGKTQFYRLPESTLEVITSSFTAAEGAQTTAAVGDETEHWLPANQGPSLMSTIADNLAKTGGRMMETCNAWQPGIGSVAEATWDDWVAQEEGRLQGDQRILYDARVAPPETDMADPRSLREALEHVYRHCPWQDVENIMSRIYRKSAKPDESQRKYLNRPTAALDAWVLPEQWAALADPTHRVGVDVRGGSLLPEGSEVVLFFDGSKAGDATALIGCRVSDGYVFTLGVWEPDGSDEWTVDTADVDAAVIAAFDRYDVAAFFADVREWESFAKLEWPKRYRDELDVWAVPSGRPPEPVAWDMRSHTYEFAKACEMVHEEIVGAEFRHDGHAATGRHVVNARRRPYRDAMGIGKESKASPHKIDAAVCVVGARMVRRLVLTSERKPARSGVVV